MAATRPLPVVIGPTENALRALLVQTLSSTGIAGHHAWVVLNAAAGSAPGDANWRDAAARALAQDAEVVDEVIAQLRDAGLLDDDGAVSERGMTELTHARVAVGRVTAGLVTGIPDSDQQVAARVLDQVRANAELSLRAA